MRTLWDLNKVAPGFFQRCSGLGHVTTMHAHCIPRWFSRTSELGSSVSLDLPLASWPNFLGLIMCFDSSQSKWFYFEYSVKTATAFLDSGSLLYGEQGILTIIIPRSIFCVRDGDDKIELKTNFEFSGIHLLYKTEITMIDE
ncbi:hypothetical protein POM88_019755 [Heracleum sosnowskyi]|uniref:Uncharacterized protein n=1 Tax=Heracleum sosnowskyi TaxID=360622 RepID=A0AAD8IBI6_9APIA|nr:hypothetical protein POM88_019751 [Heracleum sosnowskyi]KAK1382020.1 hypothetical protein POM88_019755 [Heracleum sosnowskyi]